MAEVPTSGMMLRGRGPHQRRRYVKQEEEAPQQPPEDPQAEAPAETVESPETGSSQAEQPAPAADVQEVPSDLTKVADLLDWVGDDKARAQAVLDQENAKPEGDVRVTLVSKLTSILEADLI